MKLEICKQYKTRGGWRAVVVNSYNNGNFRVWHDASDGDITITHDKSGLGGCELEFEIIEEWKEPRMFEDEVVVSMRKADGEIDVSLKSDFDDGEPNEFWEIIAIKKITITEGEGL